MSKSKYKFDEVRRASERDNKWKKLDRREYQTRKVRTSNAISELQTNSPSQLWQLLYFKLKVCESYNEWSPLLHFYSIGIHNPLSFASVKTPGALVETFTNFVAVIPSFFFFILTLFSFQNQGKFKRFTELKK